MYNIRIHLDTDRIYTVVEIDSHHRGNTTYAAVCLLLSLRCKSNTRGISLRNAETGDKTDYCSDNAPFDNHRAALPKFGDELHDVDFRLVDVLIIYIFLHFIICFRFLDSVYDLTRNDKLFGLCLYLK